MLKTRIVPFKPVMILEGQKKCLIATDIHIGFENNLASNEIYIGKHSAINEIFTELASIIDVEKPDTVILLGDIKSSIKNISKNEWNEVPLFLQKIKQKCDVVIIPGNHDGNLHRLIPTNISSATSTGIVEEDILLTHGHTMPSENFSHVNKIIMGHVHPVFFQEESVLNGERVWISMKTDRQNIFPNRSGELEITIMPSFNKYFHADYRKKHRKSISPIVEKIKFISSAKIVTLDGTIIGDESILDCVL